MDAVIAQPLAVLESKVKPEIREKLLDSAKKYEGVFMTQMLNIMFKEIDMNPMGTSSQATNDTYKGLLMNEFGNAIAQGPGIGIAQPIYKSLLEAQLASQEVPK